MPQLKNKPTLEKKTGNGSAAKKPAKKKEEGTVVYPAIDVQLYIVDATQSNPLTAEIAKEYLGWEEETKEVKFSSFLLTDKTGKKIRCRNDLTNRPFYPQLAEDAMLEILRKKWRFNGETFIVDKYGMVHDGQHRFIGLIWAVQEWEKDKARPLVEQKWQGFWDTEPWIPALVVVGIEADDDTVNTIGTGKPRTLVDVLYRCKWFAGKTEKQRQELAKVTTWAVKLLWSRTDQHRYSFAPRRPHSESLEYIANHERILECVKFIVEEGDSGKLSQLISMGYAAGLLYLMGSATSDCDVYRSSGNESALDWKLFDKAQEFWVDLAANGKATEPLREALLSIPPEVGGGYDRDLRCGLIIKAWNLYAEDTDLVHEVDPETKVVIESNIALATTFNDQDQPILGEHPRLGGIDVEYDDEPVAEAAPKKAPLADGECPRGGDHEWSDDGMDCNKCHEPSPNLKKKRK